MPMLASARNHTGANNKSYDSCIIEQWNANANINSNAKMNKNLDSKTAMLLHLQVTIINHHCDTSLRS